MKYLFGHWPTVTKRLTEASRCLLLFDFDGTLVPIQSHPNTVRLLDSTRHLLKTLIGNPRCRVGIVSGRPMGTLKELFRFSGLIYVGNHGFEIQSRGHVRIHPAAKAKARHMKSLVRDLKQRLKGIRGAWVENKRYTLSVHFRQTPEKIVPKVRRVVRELTLQSAAPGGLYLRGGKKVLEIRPNRFWNKGSAVEWLRRQEPNGACVLYAGDDGTDEDVFQKLTRRDVSIRVGLQGSTHAQFKVRHPKDIQKLLKGLVRLINGGKRT